MRKVVIAFVFCLAFHGAHCQEYRNICSPGITFFTAADGHVKAFRQDSAHALPGADTVFISYRAILGDGYYHDTTNGSVLGRKIIAKADGRFFFFNFRQDTICLQTQAGLNESWTFLRLANKARIEARVDSICSGTVLGNPDEIKTIALQAKDSNGLGMAYYLNGKKVQLSRHYGLSRTLNMYFIDSMYYQPDTAPYFLAGKTNPPLGLTPMTNRDVFDLDTGDVFHFRKIRVYQEISRMIKRVIGKTFQYSGGDTLVTYRFERCEIYSDGMLAYNHDTITEQYNLTGQGYHFSCLPGEFIRSGNKALGFDRYLAYNGRSVHSNRDFEAKYSNGKWIDPSVGDSYLYEEYATGLGKVFTWSGAYVYPSVWTKTSLVYFMKGSEAWGTPLATGCEEMAPVVTITPDTLYFNANRDTSATVQLQINKAFNWWVMTTTIPAWLSASKIAGTGSALINIHVLQENTSGSTRFADICVKMDKCYTIHVCQKAANNETRNLDIGMFRIHPNPSEGRTAIELCNPGKGRRYFARMFNDTGAEILSEWFTGEKLTFGPFPPGIYLVTIQDGSATRVWSGKVIFR